MEQLLILGLIIAGAIGGLITYTAQRQKSFVGLGPVAISIRGIVVGALISVFTWIPIIKVSNGNFAAFDHILIMNLAILILCTVWGSLADTIARGQAKRLPLHIGKSGAAAGAIALECYMAFAFLTTPILIKVAIIIAVAGIAISIDLKRIKRSKRLAIGWTSALFSIIAIVVWFSQADGHVAISTIICAMLMVLGYYLGRLFLWYVTMFFSPPSVE